MVGSAGRTVRAAAPYRNRAGPIAGKWPIRVDRGDASRVHFQDPADNTWHALTWC
jgi:hypothetical protein